MPEVNIIGTNLVNDKYISLGIFECTDEGLGISEWTYEINLGCYE